MGNTAEEGNLVKVVATCDITYDDNDGGMTRIKKGTVFMMDEKKVAKRRHTVKRIPNPPAVNISNGGAAKDQGVPSDVAGDEEKLPPDDSTKMAEEPGESSEETSNNPADEGKVDDAPVDDIPADTTPEVKEEPAPDKEEPKKKTSRRGAN